MNLQVPNMSGTCLARTWIVSHPATYITNMGLTLCYCSPNSAVIVGGSCMENGELDNERGRYAVISSVHSYSINQSLSLKALDQPLAYSHKKEAKQCARYIMKWSL